ncbi:MAG: hypothetical protein PHE89_02135 [Alphaproteobacteria bacterium]|nr:hypothetical protein [Alphaproteobacteria bacterium]
MSNVLLREKISKIKTNRAQDNLVSLNQHAPFESKTELYSPNVEFIELINLDGLISSMNAYDSLEKKTDISETLKTFIRAYKRSAIQIYNNKEESIFNHVVQNAREKIKIERDFSKEETDYLFANFPSLNPLEKDFTSAYERIAKTESALKSLDGSKNTSETSQFETDTEALAVLEKLEEKYKAKYKGFKISSISGLETIRLILSSPKKGNVTISPNLASLSPLNNPEGVERLQQAISQKKTLSKQKETKKSENQDKTEKKNALLKLLEQEKAKLKNLNASLARNFEKHFKEASSLEIINAFEQNPRKESPLGKIISTCGNFDTLGKSLMDSFKADGKIWNYVKSADYFSKIKNLVRIGYDKNSNEFAAVSPKLKDLLEVREIIVDSFKSPTPNCEKIANEKLEEYGYQVRLQKATVSKAPLTEEFSGKNPSQVSEYLLAKATQQTKETLSPYQRRYMTLGLTYALGEGLTKNDEGMLFRKYMEVYFGKKGIKTEDLPNLQKEYCWSDFKDTNREIAQKVYEDISKNAKDSQKLKESLLAGSWAENMGANSVHHNFPRKYALCLADPNAMNNQPNLALTVHWEEWQPDNHAFEHFYNMSKNEGVHHYLGISNGKIARSSDLGDFTEIFYEKPQTASGEDFIPENTLYVSSNVTVQAPTLPEKVKSKTLDCFKDIPEVQKAQNINQNVFIQKQPVKS